MASKLDLQERRKRRLRYQIRMKSGGRPRLSIFRSGKHIYAQVIDDAQGRTVAAASSLEKTMREALKTGADTAAASAVIAVDSAEALVVSVEAAAVDSAAAEQAGVGNGSVVERKC